MLSGKMLQHMQQQGVSYSHCTKSKGCDQHQIVRFSVELLEEVETLAPSCLLTGVHKFPQHDNVVAQTFAHLQALLVIASLWASGCKGRKGGVSHYAAVVEVHTWYTVQFQCVHVHTRIMVYMYALHM
ncbi:hypothetical protein DB44_GR00010 [Candidatus Protochlamydia amoebophila]|uniref:Uncharacterized protein n=1 Tax=Candidatus Protochlamydia amoebophila TaxID=362787 RepID=A0A0C1H6Y8_9BACT|nr:hypothetical protein DB44_GR00010 [Candidatus Protochlamydia amoebophila]